MKTIILIGGTAYSGSTLLDMLLANDEHGFSCGEIHALATPFRPFHINPKCGCGDARCDLWKGAQHRLNDLHEYIAELKPSVNFLVDSSKALPWLYDTDRRLSAKGWTVRHVLIWKSPGEYLASRLKRGEVRGWARSWINYHQTYMRVASAGWVSVRYADLVQNPSTLQATCEALDIPYFDDKAEYWRKQHHTLFGNSSAKIHLHDSRSIEYSTLTRELSATTPSRADNTAHRSIYYAQVDLDVQDKRSDREVRLMASIEHELEQSDVKRGRLARTDSPKTKSPSASRLLSPVTLLRYYRARRFLQTAKLNLLTKFAPHSRQGR